MIDRVRLYRAAGKRIPFAWKALRLALWGRINFNDLSAWENCYGGPSDEELQKLTNRIPNVVNAALEMTEQYDSILEISAGYGNFVGKVASSKQRHATEFSTAAVDYLNRNGIATQKATLPDLPYEDGAFDLVASFSVFEHLPNAKTLSATFRECRRICKAGMILSVPFGCMQPWEHLVHNFDFTKDDIVRLCKSLFSMQSWQVIEDGVSARSLCFLKAI